MSWDFYMGQTYFYGPKWVVFRTNFFFFFLWGGAAKQVMQKTKGQSRLSRFGQS